MLRLPQQPVALVPFLLGALDTNYLHLNNLLIVGIGLLFLSIGSFVINEYVDSFDTDVTNERKDKLLDFKKHKKIILGIFILLNILGSVIFIKYGLVLPLVAYLFVSFFYSVPPLRFKAHFPWDMIAPLIAWGAIPYSICFSLSGLPYESTIHIASLSMAFFGIPMQGIHYLADAEDDKKAGITNWCIVLGYRNFLKVIDKFAIIGLFGFIYLIYRREYWWYYPIVLASMYELLILGYARAAIYFPTLEKLHSIATRSYKKGVQVFILILIWLIWAILKVSGTIS